MRPLVIINVPFFYFPLKNKGAENTHSDSLNRSVYCPSLKEGL